MGVQGVGRMEDEAEPNPIGPTLWRLFGYFLPGQKVTRPAGRKPVKRRAGAAKLPVQAETRRAAQCAAPTRKAAKRYI